MKFRSVLPLLAALVLAAPPGYAQTGDQPMFRRGFNVFPWIYRARTLNNDVKQFDFEDTYPNLDRFTQSGFQSLKEAGADVIRAPVEPSPFLVANPEQRTRLVSNITRATDRITRLGMTMIVELYPKESVPVWTSTVILGSADLRDRYREMTVELAKALSAYEGKVVLELMNEPPSGWTYFETIDWFSMQEDLVKSVRSVAPKLTLLLTGDKGGGVDGLMRFDPSKLDDPNMLYSFHYYEPMVVTHQGATWGVNPYRKFFSGVDYPVRPETRAGRLADIATRAADGDKSQAQKAAKDLNAYYDAPASPETIAADFKKVSDWGRRYKIPPSRIVLGEFGVMRPGASQETAVNWTRDVRVAAEKAGFPWIYFNYSPFYPDAGDFSILRMREPDPKGFDSDILETGLGMKTPTPR